MGKAHFWLRYLMQDNMGQREHYKDPLYTELALQPSLRARRRGQELQIEAQAPRELRFLCILCSDRRPV